jgi:transcriptional regulator with XRE-family HTH domain
LRTQSRSGKPTAVHRRDQAFGSVLQELRREKKLSQEELAFRSGYHRTYISFLERGIKGPSLATVMDLAQTLEVPAAEMVAAVEGILKLPMPGKGAKR